MKIKFIVPFIVSIFFIVFFACQKKETISLPSVETASVDETYNTSARVGGKILSDGGAEVTSRGIYWGILPNPDSTGTKIIIGKGMGTFYDTLSGLTRGTKYYIKAFATNSQGTSVGLQTFFTTQINLPTVTTSAVTDLTTTSAKVGGNVTDNGGFSVTQRGVYWGNLANPLLTGNRVNVDTGKGAFSYSLTGLSLANIYYVKAFATNIKGTSYGDEISFSNTA